MSTPVERQWGTLDIVADGDHVVILKADPVIRITAALLADIASGKTEHATLTPAEHRPDREICWYPAWWPEIRGWEHIDYGPIGAILRIEAVNRTVIYRITEYKIEPDWFAAEWPD